MLFFSILFRLWALYYATDYELMKTILLFSQSDTLALGGFLACVKREIVPSWVKNIFDYFLVIGLLGLFVILIIVGWINGDIFKGYYYTSQPIKYTNNPFTVQIFLLIGLIAVGLIKICTRGEGLVNEFLNLILKEKSVEFPMDYISNIRQF